MTQTNTSWTKTCGKHGAFGGQGTIGGDCPSCAEAAKQTAMLPMGPTPMLPAGSPYPQAPQVMPAQLTQQSMAQLPQAAQQALAQINPGGQAPIALNPAWQRWQKTCPHCNTTFGDYYPPNNQATSMDCPLCPIPSDALFPNHLSNGMAPRDYISAEWVENPNVPREKAYAAAQMRASQGYANPATLPDGTPLPQPPGVAPLQKVPQHMKNTTFSQSNGQQQQSQAQQQQIPPPPPPSTLPRNGNGYAPPPPYQQQDATSSDNTMLARQARALERIADALERLSPVPQNQEERQAQAIVFGMSATLARLAARQAIVQQQETKALTNGAGNEVHPM